MTPELREELLHLIGTSKGGITTSELLAEIAAFRPMGLWRFEEPTTRPDLGRLLTASGWVLESQVRNVQPGPRVLPALFE